MLGILNCLGAKTRMRRRNRIAAMMSAVAWHGIDSKGAEVTMNEIDKMEGVILSVIKRNASLKDLEAELDQMYRQARTPKAK